MKKKTKYIIIGMWSFFGFLVLLIFTLSIFIYNGWIGYMPPIEDLKNPKDKFASVVISSDGVEIGRYYQNKGNRVYVDFDEISQHVIDALVATEDIRYVEHSGIDIRAFFRAVVKRGLLGQKNAGGGSTITQQLAKLLYSPTSRSVTERLFQKPIEWAIAVKLERYYTKDEIIKMYLNEFDFLNNAVGIKTASYVYFGKGPKDLTIEEAATLVGMVKNPSYYNPIRYKERTRERRNVVLEQMYKAELITKAQLDSLSALPITLKYHKVDHKEGLAPYFREDLRLILTAKKPIRYNYPSWDRQSFVDDSTEWENNPLYGWQEKNTKPDGSKYNIYTDGLKIYTTIDSRMQKYAEEAVQEHLGKTLQPNLFREKRNDPNAPYTSNPRELRGIKVSDLIEHSVKQSQCYRALKASGMDEDEIKEYFNTPKEMTVFSYAGDIDTTMTPMDSLIYHKHFLRTGFLSMDPTNGHVKAYVGGPNFKHFQYDMVSKGRRQIGSTIKPYLYTYAMEEGFTPCDMFPNTRPTIKLGNGRVWRPRGGGGGGMLTLKMALTKSNNAVTARLMDTLSVETLISSMHEFGITSYLKPVVSICLGSCDISVKEMVSAYTAYANQGMRAAPIYVTRIADSEGNIISEFIPRQNEAISQDAYYKILSMLLSVVDHGTGSRLRRPPFRIYAEMGGKTGTTNYNADGWFMGFTPKLVTGVWVGGEERFIHFRWGGQGQGAAMALPIYGLYMNKVYNDKTLPYSQKTKFEFPSGFDPCYKEFYDIGPVVEEQPEEAIEGIFD